MAQPAQTPGLPELRVQIDALDSQLLELLSRRAEISLAIGQAKARTGNARVYDPVREAQLLASLAERNPGPLTVAHIEAIWREIMSASRSLQKKSTVAYLGPEGTFSCFAAADALGSSSCLVPCRDFDDIFHRVATGECDMGFVPLENSIHGTITQSFDLFARHQVCIRAEFYSRIANSLISKEAGLESVHTVYSHAQPLGQCADWLRMHLPNAHLVSVESTAAAAQRASQEQGAASIGHRSMAEKLGMHSLADNIQDDASNWTRFVLIEADGKAPQTPVSQNAKSSILFTVANKAGSLSAVLDVFSRHHINMTKLESRPMKGACWSYVFFADVECDLNAPEYSILLDEMKEHCTSVRVLGCYPAGPHLDSTVSTTGY
ncbi:MAG: prephenate dehydratase [Mailhella sp.]|nr:prephenate dehydratase [Mailhella sp.]